MKNIIKENNMRGILKNLLVLVVGYMAYPFKKIKANYIAVSELISGKIANK